MPTKQWPQTSRFFDPAVMISSNLRARRDGIMYGEHALSYTRLYNDKVTHAALPVTDRESGIRFIKSLKRGTLGLTIFFLHSKVSAAPITRPLPYSVTIGVDPDFWSAMVDGLDIHPHFVESMNGVISRCAAFVTYGLEDKPEFLHICARTPATNILEGGFYLRHDLFSNETLVIITDSNLTTEEQTFVQYAEHIAAAGRFPHPFSIAVYLLKRYFRMVGRHRRAAYRAIVAMESETSQGALTVLEKNLSDIHWIGAQQRKVTLSIDFHLRLVNLLRNTHEQLIKLRGAVHEDPDDRQIQQTLTAHRASVQNALADCKNIEQRAQWQLSVADIMISTWIARQSQRTADESKAIAIETRKDSTSMKTIAGLTMVYLPSTFIATVFGMGFFYFEPGDAGRLRVNADVWKFVVISLVLTLVTLCCWVYLNVWGLPAWMHRPPAAASREDSQPVALWDEGGSRPPSSVRARTARTFEATKLEMRSFSRPSHEV